MLGSMNLSFYKHHNRFDTIYRSEFLFKPFQISSRSNVTAMTRVLVAVPYRRMRRPVSRGVKAIFVTTTHGKTTWIRNAGTSRTATDRELARSECASPCFGRCPFSPLHHLRGEFSIEKNVWYQLYICATSVWYIFVSLNFIFAFRHVCAHSEETPTKVSVLKLGTVFFFFLFL